MIDFVHIRLQELFIHLMVVEAKVIFSEADLIVLNMTDSLKIMITADVLMAVIRVLRR